MTSRDKQYDLQMAIRFFEWYRFRLSHIAEKLELNCRGEFDLGKIPERLTAMVLNEWSQHLMTSLPWPETISAWKSALPDMRDQDRVMNCSMHLLAKLPKRIRNALAHAERSKAKEIHDAFFRNGGRARVAEYLKVAQSKRIAHSNLIVLALGYRRKENGGASIGETQIDIEQMLLAEAGATGSAMQVGHLLPFIKSLWETDKTVLVKKTGVKKISSLAEWENGLERKVIPNPSRSEPRLNRFLIKLGQALADKAKRRQLPDWNHMDQTVRFVVEEWCGQPVIDGSKCPPLCLFSTPALAKILSYCQPPRWHPHRDPRTLERTILRHGLVRIQRGRIKNVTKNTKGFCFT